MTTGARCRRKSVPAMCELTGRWHGVHSAWGFKQRQRSAPATRRHFSGELLGEGGKVSGSRWWGKPSDDRVLTRRRWPWRSDSAVGRSWGFIPDKRSTGPRWPSQRMRRRHVVAEAMTGGLHVKAFFQN
jgi:hypothetical protein